MDSPNFRFIWQQGTNHDLNHTVPVRQGSAVHEILTIIESPLIKAFLGKRTRLGKSYNVDQYNKP